MSNTVRKSCAIGNRCRAKLVPGEDPAEHDIGALAAEIFCREFHGRRHGGEPVKAIEHREQRQPVNAERRVRQMDQRQAAQAGTRTAPAIVVAVRQPA